MNKQQLREDLNERLSAAQVTGLWTDAAKDLWINQAGQRVCNFRKWKWLELALETQTRNNQEYYDYPEPPLGFKKDSIYQIDIEGEEYPSSQSGRKRIVWNRFQKEKQMESDTKTFTNHNGYLFLHPIPENGKIMSIYGLKEWVPLQEETDTPVSPDYLDEAIVRVALATCLRKEGKHNEAQAELLDVFDPVTGLLEHIYKQEIDESPRGYIGTANSSRW